MKICKECRHCVVGFMSDPRLWQCEGDRAEEATDPLTGGVRYLRTRDDGSKFRVQGSLAWVAHKNPDGNCPDYEAKPPKKGLWKWLTVTT